MRLLKVIDNGGYTDDMPVIYKETVRAIIVNDGKIAMQRSRDGEYKIPGGGIERHEDCIETLCRETLEEAGMKIISDSIRELGEIIELRCDKFEQEKKFERHTYYYACNVTDEVFPLALTESEQAMGFECVWETPENIYNCNKEKCNSPYVIRDTLFIKMILDGEIDLE